MANSHANGIRAEYNKSAHRIEVAEIKEDGIATGGIIAIRIQADSISEIAQRKGENFSVIFDEKASYAWCRERKSMH